MRRASGALRWAELTVAGSQDSAPDPRNAGVLIYLNGALVPREQARVSIFDGGFVVGDGVWEGLRLHKDTLLFLEQHLERLYAGAARIKLNVGLEPPVLAHAIRRTLDANRMRDGVHIRVMVTRGEKSAPNQDPTNALGAATIAIVAEYRQPDPRTVATGLKVFTASIRCTGADMFDMRLNSHSRLNLILALLQAQEAGADEALMLDPHGFVSSCNATNFFFVSDGVVRTSRGEYCFNGVTRGNVIRLCRNHAVPMELGDFTLADVQAAQEAFVTGTFGGLTPVRQIDGRALPQPLPGPLTTRLRTLYEALKDQQAGQGPP